MELCTVKELIEHLKSFDDDAPLIVDVDGNTFHPTVKDIGLWNPEDSKSPVAIMTQAWLS